jgi:rhodanese-related sulfurtransferase
MAEGLAYFLVAEMIENAVVIGTVSTTVFSRHWQAGGGGAMPDGSFGRSVAEKVANVMGSSLYLFVVASPDAVLHTHLSVFSSSANLVRVLTDLIQEEFAERISKGDAVDENDKYRETVLAGWNETDEQNVVNLVRQAVEPLAPPPGSLGIDEILARARTRLLRVDPQTAHSEHSSSNAILVDIRPEAQRLQEGKIPGALIIERNVLEWRFDPRSDARLPIADRFDLRVIVFCQEGYTSSLAAASLQDLGLSRATDIEGGFAAWKASGLPTNEGKETRQSLIM